MKYASLGSSIVDNIIRRDGTKIENIAGGMAVFAYAGMRLYTDDVMLLTGVGDDYDRFYGDWIERNSVPRQGLIRRHEHTMNIVLSYDDDKGGYVTHSIYGDDEHRARHQAALDIGGEALEPFAKDIEWLYLGWNWLQDRPGIDKLKEKYGFKIMWEINSASQVLTFLYSIVLGFSLGIFFDLPRSFRSIVRYKKSFMFISDLFFWIISAFFTFCFYLVFTNGELRGFVVFGILIGFLIERLTLSQLLVKIYKKIFLYFKRVFRRFVALRNKIIDKTFDVLSAAFKKRKIMLKKCIKSAKKP